MNDTKYLGDDFSGFMNFDNIACSNTAKAVFDIAHVVKRGSCDGCSCQQDGFENCHRCQNTGAAGLNQNGLNFSPFDLGRILVGDRPVRIFFRFAQSFLIVNPVNLDSGSVNGIRLVDAGCVDIINGPQGFCDDFRVRASTADVPAYDLEAVEFEPFQIGRLAELEQSAAVAV